MNIQGNYAEGRSHGIRTAYGSLFVDSCVSRSVHGIQRRLLKTNLALIRATQTESDISSKMH